MGSEATFEDKSAVSQRTVSRFAEVVRDTIELTKPRITVLEVTMMLGGLALAPVRADWVVILGAALGTGLVVAAANALNMYMERDSDRHMDRTRHRPLPSGRLNPKVALTASVFLLIAAMATLWGMVNPVTTILGAVGFASYVFVYTPLKRISTLALPIGALPGAIPALMGWTAATGNIGLVGLAYTGVLFFWQIPHFLAIAMYRKDEYAKADLLVLPNVKGDRAARIQMVGYTAVLVAVSLSLVFVGAAGWLYFVVAAVLGTWFFLLTIVGSQNADASKWGRKIFIASLIYLPILALGLVVDVVIG